MLKEKKIWLHKQNISELKKINHYKTDQEHLVIQISQYERKQYYYYTITVSLTTLFTIRSMFMIENPNSLDLERIALKITPGNHRDCYAEKNERSKLKYGRSYLRRSVAVLR